MRAQTHIAQGPRFGQRDTQSLARECLKIDREKRGVRHYNTAALVMAMGCLRVYVVFHRHGWVEKLLDSCHGRREPRLSFRGRS